MSQKPSIPKGTRDFGPAIMARRNLIFNTIRSVYQKYGFEPLETPAVENLKVLTGKYGDEGDKLIFKILNSGDFLKKTTPEDVKESALLTPKIAEKALRYDLTVPFARYVVMNQSEITFPFKRYQIQPVWRADRPQKGRYREFYQCDADVVGTNSLLCEAEIVLMLDEVLTKLGIPDFTIKLNNRKILTGIVEAIGKKGEEEAFCVAIDKLDKIGEEGVKKELLERGFENEAIDKASPILKLAGSNTEILQQLKPLLQSSETGLKGVEEVETVLQYLDNLGFSGNTLALDISLARGLSYYTGAIFEVKANNVQIGSISGGGRYDNLTGVFGLPDVSGVGISFGVDRIYDVMDELGLFPDTIAETTKVLICPFDEAALQYGLGILKALRQAGINTELYPDAAKMKKQLNYANNKQIPYVILIGSNEIQSGQLALKNMASGEQSNVSTEEAIKKLGND